jgi:hypothetical protein
MLIGAKRGKAKKKDTSVANNEIIMVQINHVR